MATSDTLALKIFVCSMLLQEFLDETDGNTMFKHKLKFHIKSLQKELDKLLDESIESEELSLYLTNASAVLEDALSQEVV